MTAQPGPLRPPVRPMIARPVRALPDKDRAADKAFEAKADGFRTLGFRWNGRALLQSRHERPLTRYFPEVAAAVLGLPEGTVIDGELVVWRGGRLDFTALQQRLHPAASRVARLASETPAALMVFDILAEGGADLRRRPYRERRERLEQLLGGARGRLALMPMTRDPAGAAAWMTDHAAAGVEGVVIKRVEGKYLPGLEWWEKCRTRMTTEAVVGGVRGPLGAPRVLLLGRCDGNGRLRVVGRTTTLSAAARNEVGAVLSAPRGPHPWPERIPPSWLGRFSPEPVDYLPVEPRLVVEVDADTAFERGRFRHATTLERIRAELHPLDLSPWCSDA